MLLTTLTQVLMLTAAFADPQISALAAPSMSTLMEVRSLSDFVAIEATDGVQLRVQQLEGPASAMVEGSPAAIECVQTKVKSGVLLVTLNDGCADSNAPATVWVQSAKRVEPTLLGAKTRTGCTDSAGRLCRHAM